MKISLPARLSASLLVAALAGCASNAPDQSGPYKPLVPQVTDPVVDGLKEDTDKIKGMLKELTLLERSRQLVPQLSKDPAANLSPGDPLGEKVTIEWTGEADLVVKRVALVAGWRFAVKGSAPFSAVVSVKAVDQPLINVLEDIAVQLGNQADIKVDKDEKSIVLVLRS